LSGLDRFSPPLDCSGQKTIVGRAKVKANAVPGGFPNKRFY